MFSNNYDAIQSLLNHLNIQCGNILHFAVYTRNLYLFKQNVSNDQLLNEKFEGYTPLELAKKLDYNEFMAKDQQKNTLYHDICIKEAYFEKYVNPIIGYSTRRIKMTVNNFYSVSEKITEIPIEEMNVRQEKNKLIIKYKKKKYKYVNQDVNEVDTWYKLLQSKEDRVKETDKIKEEDVRDNETNYEYNNSHINPYVYILINKILAQKISDPKVIETLRKIKPLDLYIDTNNMLELQSNSSGDFYSSESSEFFEFEDTTMQTYKMYRNTLPHKTCSSFEPLSYLQKLTEQFQFVAAIQEREDDLSLFIEVVSYIISSYAIFRNRTRKCFEPFVGETFTIKDNDFEVFVEKSDATNINLIFFSNDITIIINNYDVEIRIDRWLFTYEYNLTRLDKLTINKTNDKEYNIINSVTNVRMYKYAKNTNQGNLNNTDLFLHTKDELNSFDLILVGEIQMKNDAVSGTIKRRRNTEIVLKGKWHEKVIFKYLTQNKKETVWQNKANTYKNYYNFTLFTMQLNHHVKCLKSDSRNREDIKALENGNVAHSRECNEVLINRERIRESENNLFKPRFFNGVNGRWIFVSGNVKNDTSFTN
ncbi:hypothetical protein BDAP_002593 [Binucleata daphniae]